MPVQQHHVFKQFKRLNQCQHFKQLFYRFRFVPLRIDYTKKPEWTVIRIIKPVRSIGINIENIKMINFNGPSAKPGPAFSPDSYYNMLMLVRLKTTGPSRVYLKIPEMKFRCLTGLPYQRLTGNPRPVFPFIFVLLDLHPSPREITFETVMFIAVFSCTAGADRQLTGGILRFLSHKVDYSESSDVKTI